MSSLQLQPTESLMTIDSFGISINNCASLFMTNQMNLFIIPSDPVKVQKQTVQSINENIPVNTTSQANRARKKNKKHEKIQKMKNRLQKISQTMN